MSHRNSIDDVIERRRHERDVGGGRLVDLRIDLELDGEILLTVGGVWDRRLGDYDGEAETGVVIRMHPGQRRAVEWFATWLAAHAYRREHPPAFNINSFEVDTDPAHVYSALFAGGRRGGKTWIAVGGVAATYAVAFPGSIVWIVSPSDKKHEEVRRYLAGALATDWITVETLEGWELCNGSQIQLKSAYGTGDGLKEGKANIVILNEGQMMAKRAYTVARGAIVDSSGIVVVCANPPVETKDQQWVSDFAADAAAGRRASVFLDFNPLENPHIDRAALLAMRSEVDERTFAVEVLGQFRGAKDAVAWNWIRLENERPPPPDLADVTEQFLAELGEGPGIQRVAGLDVQRFPYIGGPIFKFYGDPSRDNVIAWIVGEVVLEGGDEVDWCTAMRDRGFGPGSTLIVCDASGSYQHSRRGTADAPPPTWKGRGSFSIIRGEGYRRIVPPSRTMKVNPQIIDRARAFTSMICSGTGRRRLFADPDLAPRTCEAIREWKTVHGTPSRSQTVAHLGDGASYPIVRLFPRTLRSGKPGAVDPVAERVDRIAAPASAGPLRIVPPTRGPRRGSRTRGM